MGIYRGSTLVDKVYRGATAVDRVYRGSQLVWEYTPPVVDPTATYWNSNDGGTDGQPVVAGDVPGSGVAWSAVSPSNIDYSAAASRHPGGLGFTAGAAAGTYTRWTLPAAVSQHSIGFWFRPPSLTSPGDVRIADIRVSSGSGTTGGVLFTSEGRFRIMDTSIGKSEGQSPPIPSIGWYWVSLVWDLTGRYGRLRVYDASGGLWHDSGDYTHQHNTNNAGNTVRFGMPSGTVFPGMHFDDLQYEPDSLVPLPPWLPGA